MEQAISVIQPIGVDIAVSAVLLLIALIHAKRGLYNSVMPIVVVVLALFVGITFSQIFLPTAESYIFPQIEESISNQFDTAYETAMEGLLTPTQVFQEKWNTVLEDLGYDTIEFKQLDMKTPHALELAKIAAIVKAEKTASKLIQWALFGVFTALGLLVLTIIKNIVGEVSDWPVIHWLDWWGGFAIGAIEAVVVAFVAIRVCGFVGIDFFQNYAEGTHVLQFFTGTDPKTLLEMATEYVTQGGDVQIDPSELPLSADELQELTDNIDKEALAERLNEAKDKAAQAAEVLN